MGLSGVWMRYIALKSKFNFVVSASSPGLDVQYFRRTVFPRDLGPGGPYSLRVYGPPDRTLPRTVYPMTPAVSLVSFLLLNCILLSTNPTAFYYVLFNHVHVGISPVHVLNNWVWLREANSSCTASDYTCITPKLNYYYSPLNTYTSHN